MKEIKRMDHRQLEEKMSEVLELGKTEAGEEKDTIWQQAVEEALKSLPGIGPKRKELFMEYLRGNLKVAGICIK